MASKLKESTHYNAQRKSAKMVAGRGHNENNNGVCMFKVCLLYTSDAADE